MPTVSRRSWQNRWRSLALQAGAGEDGPAHVHARKHRTPVCCAFSPPPAGRFTGFPSLGVQWQRMESEVMRYVLQVLGTCWVHAAGSCCRGAQLHKSRAGQARSTAPPCHRVRATHATSGWHFHDFSMEPSSNFALAVCCAGGHMACRRGTAGCWCAACSLLAPRRASCCKTTCCRGEAWRGACCGTAQRQTRAN